MASNRENVLEALTSVTDMSGPHDRRRLFDTVFQVEIAVHKLC